MLEKQRKASLCRIGAYCAFIAGLCYSLIVCCAFLSPASIASYVTSVQYFEDFKSYRSIFIFLKALMIIANSAFVGVVLAFHSLVRAKNYGKMTVLSAIAIIGLGVGVFQSVLDMTMVPYLADQYELGSTVVKEVIIAIGVANPAIYIISLGFPGIWFIFVSLMAFNNKSIPRLLVLLGFLWGVGNIVTVFAHVVVIIWLIYFVAFGALCAAPIWSIWEGAYLLRIANTLQDEIQQDLDLYYANRNKDVID
jgi:hypothetical protein